MQSLGFMGGIWNGQRLLPPRLGGGVVQPGGWKCAERGCAGGGSGGLDSVLLRSSLRHADVSEWCRLLASCPASFPLGLFIFMAASPPLLSPAPTAPSASSLPRVSAQRTEGCFCVTETGLALGRLILFKRTLFLKTLAGPWGLLMDLGLPSQPPHSPAAGQWPASSPCLSFPGCIVV